MVVNNNKPNQSVLGHSECFIDTVLGYWNYDTQTQVVICLKNL